MTDMEPLREWLNQECDKRHLTWREASIRAGVYPGAISAIMNGQRPGLEVCKALAQSFGTSPDYVLRLAGHLPPAPSDNHIPPQERARIDHIIDIWRELAELDPSSLGRLLNVVEGQAQMALALLEAGRRLELPNNEERSRRPD